MVVRAEAPRAWGIAALLPIALGLCLIGGCARDPAVVAWVGQWEALSWQLDRDRLSAEHGAHALRVLEQTAPTLVDRDTVRLRLARLLRGAGRRAQAFRVWTEVAQDAHLRRDRARAHYERAMMAWSEATRPGRTPAAQGAAQGAAHLRPTIALMRRIVETYPDLWPGARALQHLESLAASPPLLHDHLLWTRATYPRLRETSLGDNLAYHAARTAYRIWRATGEPYWAEVAELLYGRLDRDHHRVGLWERGLWELAWLYHHQGRHEEAIEALMWMQQYREPSFFIGSYESNLYVLGLAQIGRTRLVHLGDPAGAAEAYRHMRGQFPRSRHVHYASFYLGCASLRAGRPAQAGRVFAALEALEPESRWVRKIPEALAGPHGAICDPEPIEEEP